MRRSTFAVVVGLAAVATWPSPAQARAADPRPAYAWAFDATLVVAGRVESADGKSGTLRITRTLAGHADGDTVAYAPTSFPRCHFTNDPEPPDFDTGDEIALFLVKGDGATYGVVDNGYGAIALGGQQGLTKASIDGVERLVSIMGTADLDARDRGMLGVLNSEDSFLRRAALWYLHLDLGVAKPLDRMRATKPEEDLANEVHRAAVRRFGDEIAAFVDRENGGDVTGAALAALADASCAPSARLGQIVRFLGAIAPIDFYQRRDACRVLACYDSPVAADLVSRLATDHPEILAVIGPSRSADVKKLLLAEMRGADERRAPDAARGLAEVLERGRDAEIEEALVATLKGPVGPSLEASIACALRSALPLDVVSILLDKLASESLTAEGEDTGTHVLWDYLRAEPPIPGVRELIEKRQAVVIDRLDAGKTQSTRAIWLLMQLGTPEAIAAVRRAAATFPDAAIRRDAEWRIERLGR